MKFNTKEKKQIESRFAAMYDLLTKKVWMQGAEAFDKDENEVEPTSQKAVQFCLIGAVKHINGPTEEQITALTALAILKTENMLDDATKNILRELHGDRDDWMEVHPYPDRLDGIISLIEKWETGGVLDDSILVCGNWCESAEDVIVTWNDEDGRTHQQVRKMLKMAQGLYGKLMPVHIARLTEKAMLARVTASMEKTAALSKKAI